MPAALATADYGTALAVVFAAHDAERNCTFTPMRRDLACKERGSPPGNCSSEALKRR